MQKENNSKKKDKNKRIKDYDALPYCYELVAILT